MKQSRLLIKSLFFSVAINLALVGVFFYFMIRDNPLHISYPTRAKTHIESTSLAPAFLERLKAFPFERLVELLNDERKIERGLGVRDFALGALASYHDFDAERALGRGEIAKKRWEDEVNFVLFPGLNDEDFEIIIAFAKSQQCPLTTKGIYQKIKNEGVEEISYTLLEYFCHTPEFILLETLFTRADLPIQRGTLISLALEMGWEKLQDFRCSQENGVDFSEETRKKLLQDTIEAGSKTAAYLYTLSNPSSSEPKEIAGHSLLEEKPQKELRPIFRKTPPAAPDPRTHIVQPGESLWLLSKKYKVPIESMMEANGLSSTVIQPGKVLKIPH